MTKKINQLLKGKTTQLKHDEIEAILAHIPNIGHDNYKKLEKAFRNNKGCRICLREEELEGCGFMNVAKKGAKIVRNNKQLNKLKDQAINKAVDYGMEQVGADEQTSKFVKGLTRGAVNQGLNQMSQGAGFNFKKGLKMGAKALKVGNKISNAMGYDNLQDMAIDAVADQTIGRIDPTLGRMAGNALSKVADKQIDRYSGGALNPFLPQQLRGGALNQNAKTFNDRSNIVHYGSDAYHPSSANLPMFDRLKFQKSQMGAGFRVYT